MLKRLAYGVSLPVVLAVVCTGGQAGTAHADPGTDAFADTPWKAPEAAAFAGRAALSVVRAGRLSLRLNGHPDAAATTLPTGGHDWQGRETGNAVSAELTYVLPAQGRMAPYVGLRVTHRTAEGAEQGGISPDSPADSEYGVGARTGITLITGAHGQVHTGLAVTFADSQPAGHPGAAAWRPTSPDATRLDLALLYSLRF